MSSPHKPRKRKRETVEVRATSSADSAVVVKSSAHGQAPAFPLAAFLWPARRATSQWIVLPLILMVVGLFRWAIGLWGYSGFQTPPLHGDFEAQRHWMELTSHLKAPLWYFYDLGYWGLDYPPLTAYHSWLLGKCGSLIDPSLFALNSSRGIETPLLKLYMRSTVLISEYLTYIPAAIVFNRRHSRLTGNSSWESSVALVAILMQPSTMLIDHAHFQYNTVMLGFLLASLSSLFAGRLIWGCLFFVAALSFKQMALYYAPAMFAYLLGICLVPGINLVRFSRIAIATLFSFGLVFGPILLISIYEHGRDPSTTMSLQPPYLLKWVSNMLGPYFPGIFSPQHTLYPVFLQLSQIIHRVFPLARGLFEDKVANIWLCVHTFHKLTRYPISILSRISLVATFTTILPSCLIISTTPRKDLLPYALASCAWGFFLCSFQVHEKSVLLPLLPMTILLGKEGGLGAAPRAWIGWANALGVWTLFPLLKREELALPYAVLSLLWAYLLGLPPTSLSLYISKSSTLSTSTKVLHLAFYAVMLAWHVGEAFVPPPKSKPDLWVVVNCLVGAAGFGICYLWSTWQLILRCGIMEDYFSARKKIEAQKLETRTNGTMKPSPKLDGKSRSKKGQ